MSCVIVNYGLKQSRKNDKLHMRILNSCFFVFFFNEVLAEFEIYKKIKRTAIISNAIFS